MSLFTRCFSSGVWVQLHVFCLLFFSFTIFAKGNNFCEFLFASLDKKALPKGVNTSSLYPYCTQNGQNSTLKEVELTRIHKGGKKDSS